MLSSSEISDCRLPLLFTIVICHELRSVSISFLHFAVGQWQQTTVNNSNNSKKRKLIGQKTK